MRISLEYWTFFQGWNETTAGARPVDTALPSVAVTIHACTASRPMSVPAAQFKHGGVFQRLEFYGVAGGAPSADGKLRFDAALDNCRTRIWVEVRIIKDRLLRNQGQTEATVAIRNIRVEYDNEDLETSLLPDMPTDASTDAPVSRARRALAPEPLEMSSITCMSPQTCAGNFDWHGGMNNMTWSRKYVDV